MLRLHGILGHRTDAALADRLHDLDHAGGIEFLFVPEPDLARRRLRATTDRGTDCAVSLDRDEALADGAVLHIDPARAIIVRAGAPQTLTLQPRDAAAALRLGHAAGHLHWRVQFEGETLVVVLDGPRADALARIAGLIDDGAVTVVVPAGPVSTELAAGTGGHHGGHAAARVHGHGHGHHHHHHPHEPDEASHVHAG